MAIPGTFESLPVRDGHVSSYDPATHTARVVFADKGDMVSYPFQVIVPNSLKNRDEVHLDVGEHVVCVCLGNGIETGFVLGSLYDAKNSPTVADKDKRVTIFEDGTSVEYDRKEHKMTVNVKGDVSVDIKGSAVVNVEGGARLRANGGIAMTAGGEGTTLSGNFSMAGNLSVSGSINATGSIMDGASNSNHHSH
ncbi:baseplate protein [Synergistales bacterium]|nr:baseplate protein [Synergistales bacterium]